MHEISFPHLGIVIESLPKAITLPGGFTVAFYGILIGLGVVAGYLLVSFQARRTGQESETYLDFAIYAVIISILGARAYYVIFSWDDYKDDLLQILNFRGGGLAIYGGVIAGVATGIVYSWIKKIDFPLLADTCSVGLLTGQLIGRWGNFFNRECFGSYTDSLFAMRLSVEDVAQSSITKQMLAAAEKDGYTGFIQVHPTFLYESFWNFCLLIIILFYTKRKKFTGELFLIYLGGYGLGRLWIEGLRTDQLLLPGTGLAVSRVVAGVTFVVCTIAIIIGRVKTAKKRH